MVKKIKVSDYNFIINRKRNPVDFMTKATMEDSPHGYVMRCKIRLGWFLLFAPFLMVINFFICCWDGGLKEYTFPSRFVDRYCTFNTDAGLHGSYDRAKEIWENA